MFIMKKIIQQLKAQKEKVKDTYSFIKQNCKPDSPCPDTDVYLDEISELTKAIDILENYVASNDEPIVDNSQLAVAKDNVNFFNKKTMEEKVNILPEELKKEVRSNTLDNQEVFEILKKANEQYENYLKLSLFNDEKTTDDDSYNLIKRDINHPLDIVLK